MTALAYTIPIALFLGGLGLAGFLWSLKSGQYDDLDGAAWRALDDDPPEPLSNSSPLVGAAGRGGLQNASGRDAPHS